MKQSILLKLKSKFNKSAKLTRPLVGPQANWYKEHLNREQAELYLSDKQIGVFVIRRSETILDCHVLSVKVPKYVNQSQYSHYLVIQHEQTKCFFIRGYQKEFHDLDALVTHCSFMRDILPLTLNLKYYQEETRSDEAKCNDLIYYSSYNSKSSLNSLGSSQTSDGISISSEHDLLFSEFLDE